MIEKRVRCIERQGSSKEAHGKTIEEHGSGKERRGSGLESYGTDKEDRGINKEVRDRYSEELYQYHSKQGLRCIGRCGILRADKGTESNKIPTG